MADEPNSFRLEPSGDALPPAERLAALRIIDANLNRASEGLRVVEELCRFALNDRYLTECCKQLRHDLMAAFEVVPREQLHAARDTEGDPGTNVTAAGEGSRQSLADVAEANWRRVEQALRALEEYGKLLVPTLAVRIESLRYRAYTLSKACTTTAESQLLLQHARLYVLIDGGSSEESLVERVRQLMVAGVHVLQLRDKTLSQRALLKRARLLRRIIDEHKEEIRRNPPIPTPLTIRWPLLVINDHPAIAALSYADGLHLGQDDLSVRDARKVFGYSGNLIGVSTHDIEQARQAVFDGANYIGCGPTFPSGTKQFDCYPGLDFLRQVAAEISLPAFAIGGVTLGNVADVVATGVARIAVSGAIAKAGDPGAAVQQFLRALDR